MTYYKLVSKNPEEGGPPSVFVPVEDVLSRAEWEATINYDAAQDQRDKGSWVSTKSVVDAAVKGDT